MKWDNFQPNFFMVFQPGTLTDLPVTYLTSFYLPASQERDLIELARAFPTVTLLPVDALLSQLRSILDQVTLAVEYVLVFVLAAGFVVLFAGLQATLDERVRQGALLRALGAERELLQRTRRVEFALLGAVSGLLAALGCEAVSLLLYRLVSTCRGKRTLVARAASGRRRAGRRAGLLVPVAPSTAARCGSCARADRIHWQAFIRSFVEPPEP